MAGRTFKEILRSKFPEADELAFERLMEARKLFDTKNHRALFALDLIKAVLYLAILRAHQAGLKLHLTNDERKLIKGLFDILPFILLLIPDFFDYWQ